MLHKQTIFILNTGRAPINIEHLNIWLEGSDEFVFYNLPTTGWIGVGEYLTIHIVPAAHAVLVVGDNRIGILRVEHIEGAVGYGELILTVLPRPLPPPNLTPPADDAFSPPFTNAPRPPAQTASSGANGSLFDMARDMLRLFMLRIPVRESVEDEFKDRIVVPIGSFVIYRENTYYYREIEMDTTAWISPITDSTMIPIRFIGYALDLPVHWDEATRTGTIDPDGYNLRFTAGSDTMCLNGLCMPILNQRSETVPATIRDSRMFIPLRAMGEALGLPAEWLPDLAQDGTALLHVVW